MDIERAIPIVCRRCGTLLGYATPQAVRIGEVVFRSDVALCCARCDTTRVWRIERRPAGDILQPQPSRRGTDPKGTPPKAEMSARTV